MLVRSKVWHAASLAMLLPFGLTCWQTTTARSSTKIHRVYNLSIADTSTYLVSHAGAVVHNASVPSVRTEPESLDGVEYQRVLPLSDALPHNQLAASLAENGVRLFLEPSLVPGMDPIPEARYDAIHRVVFVDEGATPAELQALLDTPMEFDQFLAQGTDVMYGWIRSPDPTTVPPENTLYFHDITMAIRRLRALVPGESPLRFYSILADYSQIVQKLVAFFAGFEFADSFQNEWFFHGNRKYSVVVNVSRLGVDGSTLGFFMGGNEVVSILSEAPAGNPNHLPEDLFNRQLAAFDKLVEVFRGRVDALRATLGHIRIVLDGIREDVRPYYNEEGFPIKPMRADVRQSIENKLDALAAKLKSEENQRVEGTPDPFEPHWLRREGANDFNRGPVWTLDNPAAASGF